MPPVEPVYRHAHVLIGGFTQRLDQRANGVFKRFDEVYQCYAGPECLVQYFPWYLGPREIAESLEALDQECLITHRRRIRIQLAGFSFGGQTVANVCRDLYRKQVIVDSVCLCDAVARRGRLGWVRAMNPFTRIHFPENVRRLRWIVQMNRRWRFTPPFFHPSGHPVVTSEETETFGPYHLQCEHTDIDNSELFREHVFSEANVMHARDEEPVT